jgi:magnesium chelatase accessory protein
MTERDGRLLDRLAADWPNRTASRFVRAAGLVWHVQDMHPDGRADAPVALLVHGTGAATHSWRDLAPLLARDFRVVAMDLPGHGFTDKPGLHRLSLPAMAQALAQLLQVLDAAPAIAVGHSAGAAILVRMCVDELIAPRSLVSLNGALLPFQGVAGKVFRPAAQLLAINPLVPRLFARRARDPAVLDRLIGNTGSSLDPQGVAFYGRLAGDHRHVAGALGMMAAWQLEPIARDLRRLACHLLLVVGAFDRTVPPANAERVRALLPSARVVPLERLGHLAHEEAPERVAALIREEALATGALPPEPQARAAKATAAAKATCRTPDPG